MTTRDSYTQDNQAITYDVCNECSVAIVNNDFTSPDVDVDAVNTFLMDHWVAYLETYENGGYWECEVCHMVQLGEGVTLELM